MLENVTLSNCSAVYCMSLVNLWYSFVLVVSLLTYLLTKEELTVEEVNGLASDVVFAGVDTVS